MMVAVVVVSGMGLRLSTSPHDTLHHLFSTIHKIIQTKRNHAVRPKVLRDKKKKKKKKTKKKKNKKQKQKNKNKNKKTKIFFIYILYLYVADIIQ